MPEIEQKLSSEVIFLGAAERSAYVQDGNTELNKLNIIGLKQIVLSFIYPLNISELTLVFAFSPNRTSSDYIVKIRGENGDELGSINFGTKPITAVKYKEPELEKNSFKLLNQNTWTPIFFNLSKVSPIVITTPQICTFHLVNNQEEQIIGRLTLGVINPYPLTKERIAAIRSNPQATQALKVEIGCKHCPSKLSSYTALERNPKLEEEGIIWYEDLKDEFMCSCAKTKIPLEYIKKNSHGLLGSLAKSSGEVSFTPLYELDSFKTIRTKFYTLLSTAPKEEDLQVFLENNPLLFHQFPSLRIFHKPPILTYFNADFAILSPNKELLLIEIETSKTRLLTKNGGVGAELTHAVDQVKSWLAVVDEHRTAFLATLNIKPEEVSQIRGVVIAGTDGRYDPQELKKLKTKFWDRITFLTFNDLIDSLDSLIKKTNEL